MKETKKFTVIKSGFRNNIAIFVNGSHIVIMIQCSFIILLHRSDTWKRIKALNYKLKKVYGGFEESYGHKNLNQDQLWRKSDQQTITKSRDILATFSEETNQPSLNGWSLNWNLQGHRKPVSTWRRTL
jgi:hypothetical protein